MAEAIERFALVDRLADAGFSASIFATYNIHFPFFESVVLRRLRSSGCQHNVVLVDAAQLARCLEDPDLRPQLAGTDYTLVPVRVGGAFHPKVVLRVGKKRGSLFVGSHNLTFAGCAHNHEITSHFAYDGASGRASVGSFQAVVDDLRRHLESALPSSKEAFEAAVRTGDWLRGPSPVDADTRVIASHADARTLWTRVRELVRGSVARVLVVGPFFDHDLALLDVIARELAPTAGVVVGIEPDGVSVIPRVATSSAHRFVDVSGCLSTTRRPERHVAYLHAKMIWVQTDEGELLVAGSANPTPAAYLHLREQRNAEIVVTRWSSGTRDALLREAGLEAFLDAPIVTAAQWAEVGARMAEEPREEPGVRAGPSALVAETTDAGFLIGGRVDGTLDARSADGAELGDVRCEPADDARTLGVASPEVRDAARFLVTREAVPRTILVHQSGAVAELYTSDQRRTLRTVLGRLDEDPKQLEALLALTEKVIFDSGEVTKPALLRDPRRDIEGAVADSTDQGPASLAVDAQGRRAPSARAKRAIASGDIAVLLDALIRRLGQGLAGTDGGETDVEEAERRPTDDGDEGDVNPPAQVVSVDPVALAQYCRKRTKLLTKRAQAQLEKAAASPDPGAARTAVVQLAAVLSVLRALVVYAKRREWRFIEKGLVDRGALKELFEKAPTHLVPRGSGILERAVECEGAEFDELHVAVGLLAWSAWELDAQSEVAALRAREKRRPEEALLLSQTLLFFAPWYGDDAHAIAADAIRGAARRDLDHEAWLAQTVRRADAARSYDGGELEPTSAVGCAPGDLVVIASSQLSRVRIALAVEESSRGPTVRVAGLDGKKSSWLATLIDRLPMDDWPAAIHASMA